MNHIDYMLIEQINLSNLQIISTCENNWKLEYVTSVIYLLITKVGYLKESVESTVMDIKIKMPLQIKSMEALKY